MSRQILILGGGLSGLCALHTLKRKYAGRSDVRIRLLEKNERPGGTMRTVEEDGFRFETGPNGFLDSAPETLKLIEELGLGNDLLRAHAGAEIRYILWKERLYRIPEKPLAFLLFRPLSLKDKVRILREWFVPAGPDPEETVYDFGCRRLGTGFTEIFLEPMVSGIFAGDAARLNLKEAFPRIHEIERTYGSLFKGMLAIRRERRKEGKPDAVSAQPKGRLCSFRRGLSQLVRRIEELYRSDIACGENVTEVRAVGAGYSVETSKAKYLADQLIVSAPAYSAATFFYSLDTRLAEALHQIPYSPAAVVGLGYPSDAFPSPPKGFGYLRTIGGPRPVLGALFSSNIFPDRSPAGQALIRVILGGARHAHLRLDDTDGLTAAAEQEIGALFHPRTPPVKRFLSVFSKAIPHYDNDYLRAKELVLEHAGRHPGLILLANYLGGISMNDCIRNVKLTLEKSND